MRARRSLPDDLKKWADALYPRCGKQVLGMTLDEWYAGFERDSNPRRELMLWVLIAKVADRLWDHPASRKYQRQQVDRSVVLFVSNFVDVPAQTGVSDEFVQLIHDTCAEETAKSGPPQDGAEPA